MKKRDKKWVRKQIRAAMQVMFATPRRSVPRIGGSITTVNPDMVLGYPPTSTHHSVHSPIYEERIIVGARPTGEVTERIP